MRVPRDEFRSLGLEVHGILSDVPLHDVSAIDLPGGGAGRTISDVRSLLAGVNLRAVNPAVRALVALRTRVGRLCGWDSDIHTTCQAISECNRRGIHRAIHDVTRRRRSRRSFFPKVIDRQRRPVPSLVRSRERIARRVSERDRARLVRVRAHRDSCRIPPVFGRLRSTSVSAHRAVHGADRPVPPVHRLSGGPAQDPESLGGTLPTAPRYPGIGCRLTWHRA